MTGAAAQGKPGSPRIDRLLTGALAALVLVTCVLTRQLTTGIVCAAGLWFGGNWIVDCAIASRVRAEADDTTTSFQPDVMLASVLARLETVRAEWAATIEQRMRWRVPLGYALGVGAWCWGQFTAKQFDIVMLGVMAGGGASLGWLWAAGSLTSRYRKVYKTEVLTPLAASFGDLAYRPAVKPDMATIRSQRLFPRFDMLSAEDEIYGSYHGVPLSIIELQLSEKSGDDRRTVFDGLFVRVTLPRALSGMTAIIADEGALGQLRDLFPDRAASRVRLESPDFEAEYQVHATDQIAARALLTPAFMERFLALGARTGFARPVALAEGKDLTIALGKQGYGDFFEPPAYNRPATSSAALVRLRGDIAAVLAVADAVLDLDQFTRRQS